METITATACRQASHLLSAQVDELNQGIGDVNALATEAGKAAADLITAAATIEALEAQIPTPMSGTARLREIATWLDWHGQDDDMADVVLRAANCIDAQLAERAPASADTDALREAISECASIIRPEIYHEDPDAMHALHELEGFGCKLCDALDASQAECERLLRRVIDYETRFPSTVGRCKCIVDDGAGQ